MGDEDDVLFGLDGKRDPVEGPPDERLPDGRRRLGVGLGLGAAALAVAVAVPLAISSATAAPDQPVASTTTTPPTSSAAPSSTSSAPVTRQSAPQTTPTVDADPAALADLGAVAATLTTRVALTSPTGWDQWLPGNEPSPESNTAEGIATCPHLSERLGAALGTKMSYWKGRLPQGPSGCTWATVPLKYGPDPYDYPYVADIGFLSDGTTTEQLSGSFYHHQGRLCPSVAVPAAGDGAFVVRCEELGGISYALLTRDTRTSGVWVLYGMTRTDAAHPTRDVFRTVVEGAVAAYS